jgi:hypothetical protein
MAITVVGRTPKLSAWSCPRHVQRPGRTHVLWHQLLSVAVSGWFTAFSVRAQKWLRHRGAVPQLADVQWLQFSCITRPLFMWLRNFRKPGTEEENTTSYDKTQNIYGWTICKNKIYLQLKGAMESLGIQSVKRLSTLCFPIITIH